METRIFENAEEIAVAAAELYKELINSKPNAVLGLATGATPVPTYNNLIKMYENGEISFKDVTTFNLDEYCDLDKNDKNSYYTFMHENLFSKVDIDESKVNFLDGNAPGRAGFGAQTAAIALFFVDLNDSADHIKRPFPSEIAARASFARTFHHLHIFWHTGTIGHSLRYRYTPQNRSARKPSAYR